MKTRAALAVALILSPLGVTAQIGGAPQLRRRDHVQRGEVNQHVA